MQKLLDVARQGDAREESFYSVLKELLERFAAATGKKTSISLSCQRRQRQATRISEYGSEGKRSLGT